MTKEKRRHQIILTNVMRGNLKIRWECLAKVYNLASKIKGGALRQILSPEESGSSRPEGAGSLLRSNCLQLSTFLPVSFLFSARPYTHYSARTLGTNQGTISALFGLKWNFLFFLGDKPGNVPYQGVTSGCFFPPTILSGADGRVWPTDIFSLLPSTTEAKKVKYVSQFKRWERLL